MVANRGIFALAKRKGFDLFSGASRLDSVVAHHSQIFVLEDVAVIQVKPRVVLELHEDLYALARQDQHNILESLVRKASAKAIRITRGAGYAATLYHFELKIVDVHRVGHGRVVDEFPNLGRTEASHARLLKPTPYRKSGR